MRQFFLFSILLTVYEGAFSVSLSILMVFLMKADREYLQMIPHCTSQRFIIAQAASMEPLKVNLA